MKFNKNHILGIDIGGTGIKGAIVDVRKGILVTEKMKIKTPAPASVDNICKAVKEMVVAFKYNGVIGCGFPSVIKNGIALTAANIDHSWINTPVDKSIEKYTKMKTFVANDADLAGLAEVKFGYKGKKSGTILFLTLGTGIGSALFLNGVLIPNTEFGHLKFKDSIVEKYASNATRERENLDWATWGNRLNEVLEHMALLVDPKVILLGGGVSKDFESYAPFLNPKLKVEASQLKNSAGIIGAALFASMG
jgi:polyphosphate glucokinase